MNAILALSMTSAQATLLVCDETAESILGSRQWDNSDGSELAEHLDSHFASLLAELTKKNSEFRICKVFGVEGPGSFTGLRVSSAFLKGLSTALEAPLTGISSYDLFDEDFAFCLRPAKAASLTLEECLQNEFKFLLVSKNKSEVVSRPNCKILGLKDSPFWPSLVELQNGLKRSLSKKSFDLNYGYTPEFVQAKT
jgi:tRNA A37 threonylcarbamoyladenosine modification protein TsaB